MGLPCVACCLCCLLLWQSEGGCYRSPAPQPNVTKVTITLVLCVPWTLEGDWPPKNPLHFPSLSSAEPLLAGSKALIAILICRAPIGWGKEGQGQKGWLPFSLPDREGRQCLYSRILRWAGGLRVQLARLAALYSPVVRWAGAQSPVSCGGWKRRQAIYNVLRGVLQPFVPRMFNPQPSQPSLSL